MIKGKSKVSRKLVKEHRIAICPYLGCSYLKKVKPLKLGIFGFRKYPKCSLHKIPLVFIDEFIGNLFVAVNACLFDTSSLPPISLMDLVREKAPDEIIKFINEWMYCNPIGRGAQIISRYVDGLTRAYLRLLSKKQIKSLKKNKTSKKRYNKLRMGLKKIADEFSTFLKEFREKLESFCDLENLGSISDNLRLILKNWIKDYLKKLENQSSEKTCENSLNKKSLPLLKEKYNKILSIGTCSLILGKSACIVNEGLSAYELFSAYFEFLDAGLCNELKKSDLLSYLEKYSQTLDVNREDKLENQNGRDLFNKSNNKITDKIITKGNNGKDDGVSIIIISKFKQEITSYLESILNSIIATDNQEKIIRSKCLNVLTDFINKIETKKCKISKKADLKAITSALIYSVIVSSENMPHCDIPKISGIPNYTISKYYAKYFKDFYLNKSFNFPPYYGFDKIRNILCIYLYHRIRLKRAKTLDLVISLKNDIFNLKNHSLKLSNKDIMLLKKLFVNHNNKSMKYFSDLVEIVKHIYITSIMHKKIRTKITIKPLAKWLYKKEINLFQNFKLFYYSVIEIYDTLKKEFFDIFPKRSKTEPKNNKLFSTLIGSRIKLYIIKHIYNGKYCNKSKGKCPLCEKQGFVTNTDISRLKALEFHHTTDGKEHKYSAKVFYELYNENRDNPNFLEDLIESMESKKIVLVCANHHDIITSKYYNYFKHLISWENIPKNFSQDIFSLSPELIHTIGGLSTNYVKF
jgi:hypothetical protein